MRTLFICQALFQFYVIFQNDQRPQVNLPARSMRRQKKLTLYETQNTNKIRLDYNNNLISLKLLSRVLSFNFISVTLLFDTGLE